MSVRDLQIHFCFSLSQVSLYKCQTCSLLLLNINIQKPSPVTYCLIDPISICPILCQQTPSLLRLSVTGYSVRLLWKDDIEELSGLLLVAAYF